MGQAANISRWKRNSTPEIALYRATRPRLSLSLIETYSMKSVSKRYQSAKFAGYIRA